MCTCGSNTAFFLPFPFSGLNVKLTDCLVRFGTTQGRESTDDSRLTLIAGCVLVVSLLFSPGMLPAERPSHLYRNLIPLCLGCSMISMKGLPVQRREEFKTRLVDNQEEGRRRQSSVTVVGEISPMFTHGPPVTVLSFTGSRLLPVPSEFRLHPYTPVKERNKISQPSEVSVCLSHCTRVLHSDSAIYVVAKMRSQRREQCLRRSKVVPEPPPRY